MRAALRVVALTAVLVLAACSTGDPRVAPSTPTTSPAAVPSTAGAPGIETYVALGDSFTAAPYVPSTDLADGCFRSDGNYPALLAERLGADLADVSCSGATTEDVLEGQQILDLEVAPQIDAVTADADLVTVGIGGNDFGLFATMIDLCTYEQPVDTGERDGSPCTDRLAAEGRDLVAETAQVEDNVAGVLEEVARRAPDAQVVLVGYPHLAPPEGEACEILPIATGDLDLVRSIAAGLDDAMRGAARRTDTRFLDLRAVSGDHHICAEEPWVNGALRDTGRALEYHPFAVHQEAVADLLVRELADNR